MMPSPPLRAVLDANVLFPIALCDTLLRAATAGLYEPYWNETILDEMERNLVKYNRAMPEKARRRRMNMHGAFPRASVQGSEARIAEMTNDPKDRHVLATAVQINANVIVTQNRRHCPSHALAPYGIEAQSADMFLNVLCIAAPGVIERIIIEQADRLTNPPQSVGQVLENLSLEAPTFVRAIREWMRPDRERSSR